MARFNFPTHVEFGAGSRSVIPSILEKNSLKSPLIVTDRGLRQHPALEKVIKSLGGLEVGVFSEIYGNPTSQQVMAGVQAFKEHRADSIIAVGGGAALDVAKVIGVMVNHPGNVFDYEDRQGALPIEGPLPFMITVPTTAGTGSEVGRSSVISDDTTKRKKIIFSPRLMPQLAVLDAELSVALPASLTASTGVDALSHLVEAYWSKGFQPLCDGIALQGISLVSQHLERCFEFASKGDSGSAEHLESRGIMLVAATMGATAFQKGLGTLHSCAHALSAVCDLHHGTAISVMFRSVAEFNSQAVPEKLAAMAHAAGRPGSDARAFVSWIRELTERLSLPQKLSSLGVTEKHIPQLVEEAAQDGCHASNPRSTSARDFEDLFRACL